MPTVAQVMSQRPSDARDRFYVALVESVSGNRATISLLPSTTRTNAWLAEGLQPAWNDRVFVVISAAANVVLCKLADGVGPTEGDETE